MCTFFDYLGQKTGGHGPPPVPPHAKTLISAMLLTHCCPWCSEGKFSICACGNALKDCSAESPMYQVSPGKDMYHIRKVKMK